MAEKKNDAVMLPQAKMESSILIVRYWSGMDPGRKYEEVF